MCFYFYTQAVDDSGVTC
ncbi:hypothetical protein [Phytobacter massiliensis]|nr:hypothetical protein [Phytobacter massiliensis]